MKTKNSETAVFGAGCFWGVESIFSKTNGVIQTRVGYCGGAMEDPTYEKICEGTSGHAEVVEVTFDPSLINYTQLLQLFWRLHDPTTLNQQGHDVGTQYRSAIFYLDTVQKELARSVKEKLNSSKKFNNSIITEITKLEIFYHGEEYHQDYYNKKYQGENGPICHWLRDE